MKKILYLIVIAVGINLTGCKPYQEDLTVHGEQVPSDVRYVE